MTQQLEERFGYFGTKVRDFCTELKWDAINKACISQVIRSSGSVGVNDIEASDYLGKADELMKLKIARREAKETNHWLKLILTYEDKIWKKNELD